MSTVDYSTENVMVVHRVSKLDDQSNTLLLVMDQEKLVLLDKEDKLAHLYQWQHIRSLLFTSDRVRLKLTSGKTAIWLRFESDKECLFCEKMAHLYQLIDRTSLGIASLHRYRKLTGGVGKYVPHHVNRQQMNHSMREKLQSSPKVIQCDDGFGSWDTFFAELNAVCEELCKQGKKESQDDCEEQHCELMQNCLNNQKQNVLISDTNYDSEGDEGEEEDDIETEEELEDDNQSDQSMVAGEEQQQAREQSDQSDDQNQSDQSFITVDKNNFSVSD